MLFHATVSLCWQRGNLPPCEPARNGRQQHMCAAMLSPRAAREYMRSLMRSASEPLVSAAEGHESLAGPFFASPLEFICWHLVDYGAAPRVHIQVTSCSFAAPVSRRCIESASCRASNNGSDKKPIPVPLSLSALSILLCALSSMFCNVSGSLHREGGGRHAALPLQL